MMRRLIAAFAAALLWLAPVAASAQTLIYPSGIGAGVVTSCGTVAVSTPCLNLTQTWNAGGVTFTGILENITDTASASGSLLLDLQVAGATKFNVGKFGAVYTPSTIQADQGFKINSDVILTRDAANVLALRNGVNGQQLNIYNTFTDASNYERATFNWSSNVLQIGTQMAGTGTTTRALSFVTNATNRLDYGLTTAGTWTFISDIQTGQGNSIYWNGRAVLKSGADGQIGIFNNAQTNSATITVGSSNQLTFQAAIVAGGSISTASPVLSTNSYIQPGILTVSGLSTCNSGTRGARETVTDASQTFTAANFGTNVTNGGSNVVPVTCDGTNWKIGEARMSYGHAPRDLPAPANDNLPPAVRDQADHLWSAFG